MENLLRGGSLKSMRTFKQVPYEIKKPILAYLRSTNQTIAYKDTAVLVEGRPNVEDIERAWYAGAVSFDEEDNITICGTPVRAKIDPDKLRNILVEYLRNDARPTDIINVAAYLGIGL
jgi:hypothetical protein